MALPTLLTDGIAVGYPGRLALLQHCWLPQGTKNTSRTKPLRSVAKEKLNICVSRAVHTAQETALLLVWVSVLSAVFFPLDLLLHTPLPVLPAPNSVDQQVSFLLSYPITAYSRACQFPAKGSDQLVWNSFQGEVAAIGTWQGVQPTAVGQLCTCEGLALALLPMGCSCP